MDARHLVKILQQACVDGNMHEGPHSKRPDISVALHPDGLFLSSWWKDTYCFKIVPWEVVILSRGDAIKGMITHMRETLTDGEWKDVESNPDIDSGV